MQQCAATQHVTTVRAKYTRNYDKLTICINTSV